MPEGIERDEPDIIAGDRLVDDSDIKVIPEVQDTIIKIFPSATPLTVLQSKAKARQRKCGYYKFEYITKDKYPRKVTVAAVSAAGSSTVVVETDDYPKLAKNYVLLNVRTREECLLTADPTSGTLSNVVRNIGGTGSFQMNIGDILTIQRSVQQEADNLGTIRSVKEIKDYNYLEILRTPMGWSGRTANTSYYGGSDPESVRAATAIEHRISMENAAFFGKRHTRVTSENKLQTFTGGLEFFIESYVWDLDGNVLTERGLVEWMEDVMALGDGGYINGPGVKWAFLGNSILTEIEFFARDKIRYEPLSSKIGMRAGQFHTTHGTLNLMRHPLFVGEHSGLGFIVDMNHVRRAYYQGRDTMLLKDRHGRSFDGAEEEFLSDCGWQVEEQFAHGIIKNHRIRAA